MSTPGSAFAFSQLRNTLGNLGKDAPHRMNRYMGGHARDNKPYITGYWYFMMLPPAKIFNSTSTLSASHWMHSSAESFTPPTTSITKVDITGMGGLGSSFMAGRENTRTFTVSFREYKDLPLMKILRLWNSVFDPYQGVSPLDAKDWVPRSYKGVAVAFLCKPTVTSSNKRSIKGGSLAGDGGEIDNSYNSDIEQIYVFDGVWPESAPDDAFSNNIASNESIELSVTFSFDGAFYNKDLVGLEQRAVDRFNTTYDLSETINYITKTLPTTFGASSSTDPNQPIVV